RRSTRPRPRRSRQSRQRRSNAVGSRAVAATTTTAPVAGPLARVRHWAFGFIVFTAGPMVASAILSFTDYSIIQTTHDVGLANYRSIYDDPYVLKALRNTLLWTAMYVPSDMILSLFLASLLARIDRLGSIFRTIFYLPVMTPTVAVGITYLLLFNGSYG